MRCARPKRGKSGNPFGTSFSSVQVSCCWKPQIISRMALLFGTTWMVNAVVVSGLLCLIVAANLVYEAIPRFPLSVAYVGLFLSLVVMFVVPMQKLFFESWILRALLATLALCSPVFFAGIIFIARLRARRLPRQCPRIQPLRLAARRITGVVVSLVRSEVADHPGGLVISRLGDLPADVSERE